MVAQALPPAILQKLEGGQFCPQPAFSRLCLLVAQFLGGSASWWSSFLVVWLLGGAGASACEL
jgi:hypothetical protein